MLFNLCFPIMSLVSYGMKIAAIVGMAGAGKSEVSRLFIKHGFARIRFGDVTDEEIRRQGLELNEANERSVRERLRQEHGMAAYAKLNLPSINSAIKDSNVVIDGLYSWEEYLFLKDHYRDGIHIVAVWTSPRMRYERLMVRSERKLTLEEAISRDRTEIENLNKGGPIALADFTIINDSSLDKLVHQTKQIITELG